VSGTRTEEYRATLRGTRHWEPYLLAESHLPGPRGNLELLQAVADEGTTEQFHAFLRYTPDRAPSGTPGEFIAACGATGIGESIARGEVSLWPDLKALASDPRWRVREGVAMALQRIGDRDLDLLLREMQEWAAGTALERRAAAAGLCEPRLLERRAPARAVLALLDRITRSLVEEPERTREDVRVLRQALGYCWSVAVAANPTEGRRRLEKWAKSEDPDVRWVVRENLKKKRLERMDPEWAIGLRKQLETRDPKRKRG
jgi:hypothetical protein